MVNGEPQPLDNWCEQLYAARAAGLVLYGRALGLSHAEAEDVLQDTFVALLALPEAPAKPEHYLVRAFRNRALNYRRGLWRRLARELESRGWFEPAAGESPLEAEAMRRLARLPREQREVIVLKVWQDLTFEEIGALLALSPNTVAGRYRYGLQKLRTCLEGVPYERLEPIGESAARLASTPTRPEDSGAALPRRPHDARPAPGDRLGGVDALAHACRGRTDAVRFGC